MRENLNHRRAKRGGQGDLGEIPTFPSAPSDPLLLENDLPDQPGSTKSSSQRYRFSVAPNRSKLAEFAGRTPRERVENNFTAGDVRSAVRALEDRLRDGSMS